MCLLKQSDFLFINIVKRKIPIINNNQVIFKL